MSLVTRCPACGTAFKVVKDQLRISDGWVRCGRCSEVFDATLDLQEAPGARPAPVTPGSVTEGGDTAPHGIDHAAESAIDEPPQPSEPAEPAPAPADVEVDFLDDETAAWGGSEEPLRPEAVSTALPTPAASDHPAPAEEAAFFGGIRAGESWPAADLLSLGDEGRTAVRPPAPPPLSFPDLDLSLSAPPPSLPIAPIAADAARGADEGGPTPDDAGHAQLQKALRRARAKAAKVAKAKAREQKPAQVDTAPVVLAASEPEPHASLPMPAPSFYEAAGAGAFWRRPAVRWAMGLLAFLGVVLLLGQVAYQERDLIVARQPSLRPAMTSMCRVLDCEISALRQINDIKVDGASFSREKSDDGFRFSFTLRNAADVPLAMPAVELSLLDTQERAVVRRVLMPAEFGAPAVLPARSERAASLSLRLTGPEAAAMPPVAGFRLEALYP